MLVTLRKSCMHAKFDLSSDNYSQQVMVYTVWLMSNSPKPYSGILLIFIVFVYLNVWAVYKQSTDNMSPTWKASQNDG